MPGPPLDAFTSDALAGRAERNNAIYGRCWCVSYHPEHGHHRINHGEIRQVGVHTGRAHAPRGVGIDGEPASGHPVALVLFLHRRQAWSGGNVLTDLGLWESGLHRAAKTEA